MDTSKTRYLFNEMFSCLAATARGREMSALL